MKKPTGKITETITHSVGTVGRMVGRLFTVPLKLPGLIVPHKQQIKPGDRPGVDHLPDESLSNPVEIECIDYGPTHHRRQTIDDLTAFLDEPRPDNAAVRWININGHDLATLKALQRAYNLHTLALEDVISTAQRPKVEPYDDQLYIVVRMFQRREEEIHSEQISLFLLPGVVITIQETSGDVWEPIRKRTALESTRLRDTGADYLAYALLDAIIDHCFGLLEHFGDRLDELEQRVLADAKPQVQSAIYHTKRELTILRRVLWPTRDAIRALYAEPQPTVTEAVQPYLRDAHDHITRVLEGIDTFREMASALTEMYASSVSNRMNEVMKVLTIIATLFIPITFIAGVYGMNFEHIPELGWRWAYPAFWAVCASVTVGLLWYFRRKRWL